MNFLKSLVSKKLGVTAGAVALIESLSMSADWKGVCIAAVTLAYIVAQAYVDAQGFAPEPAEELD